MRIYYIKIVPRDGIEELEEFTNSSDEAKSRVESLGYDVLSCYPEDHILAG